jgi:hypothetical protein
MRIFKEQPLNTKYSLNNRYISDNSHVPSTGGKYRVLYHLDNLEIT